MSKYQVVGIGNAIVDVISTCDDIFLTRMGITYDQDCIGIAGHRIINFMVNLESKSSDAAPLRAAKKDPPD